MSGNMHVGGVVTDASFMSVCMKWLHFMHSSSVITDKAMGWITDFYS